MTRKNLLREDCNEYYDRYIQKVPEDLALQAGFEPAKRSVIEFFSAIPASKWEYRYAEGKWTIKEVFQHLIDVERIFAHRMFRIGRGDKTPLADFNQDIYIAPSRANEKSMESLLAEFNNLRNSTIDLVNTFNELDLTQIGTSSKWPLSARAAGFIILGHELWHMDIIRERYL